MSTNAFTRRLPILDWIRRYDTLSLKADSAAGLTTAVMLVPQAMAYALLAGLPPIVGLYASTIPPLIYAVFGTSRQLAVGPMAMASLLVAGAIHETLPPDQMTEANIIALAMLLTLLAGLCQIGLAVTRLGGLVNLLSHPVVSGFTGAAAIIIGTSQLKHVLGFAPPSGGSVVSTLAYTVQEFGQIHGLQLTVAVLSIAILVGLKKKAPKVPAALTVVVLGILGSWALGLEGRGVAILGAIPGGVPTPQWPEFTLAQATAALPMGLAIGLIGFMESISAAKTFARQNRYDIDPTQELYALGLANIGAATVGGYTVGGALSRTAVNAAAGARTPMANVITAAAVIVTLLLLTPLFYFLPTAVLAAIILVAVFGLLDIDEWIHLWKVKKDDLALLIITFCATLFGTIEMGIVIGVVASLLWLVYTSTRPEIRVLGRVQDTHSYRCIDHFPDAEIYERILILRMDAQFFFGNVAYLKETLYRRLDETPDAVALVLDASSMNALDSTAADTLADLLSELRGNRVEVFMSHVKESVMQVMTDTGLVEILGDGHLFYEVEDAVQAALRHREAVDAGVPPEEEDFGTSDALD